MRSWSAPNVPRLPGPGLPLRLYDTAAREVRETAPTGEARMYVCGITPYDATHLGHANTYLAFDLVNRAWRDAGHDVHYTQNATDVDDPLLERAAATGTDWRSLGEREIELFRSDMEALRILPPREYVGVTETVEEITGVISRLSERGAAYDVDGDVYFSVTAAPKFGAVSGYSEETMLALFAERGGDPGRAGKRHPLDWLLWRAERPGEPSWDSPFGRGRPGWHVECTAIALRNLGTGFDVAGGGSDLIFPHHEMGACEGHVATGEWPFARAYVHAGMVGLDGEKMSKSKGNLVFVSRLRRTTDPMAVRLALLAHHYRTDWEWTGDQLAETEARLARWRAAVARPAGPAGEPVLAAVRERVADDLDAPGALAAIDAWAAGEGDDTSSPALVRDVADALLGVAL
ncbi:cysteine--1-D-myo-inosityl 2-amino-2-deoxy-alpha-D-glucopyranoside ligase [Microbispora sp. H10885]|uniref:cysteine--1-D-myo-inosityl 2-amino-2-deoxy-alpha-D-glucopyranoside ligase n=1 Tax=Microbispora sp. H10885 TaxID=2729110 RepID=UPI0016016EFB|nr:cysteine--1-D-myo-inosityl 2-amino-2-deoxy-alpha-D-glucopyranoside ligase [Microbispora sp. H10885]